MKILRVVPKSPPDQPYKADVRSRVYNRLAKTVNNLGLVPSSKPYNLSVSHQKKFVWFRVAKTGTRSLLKAMDEQGIHLDAVHPMNLHYPAGAYESYFQFSIVRNPWDRLVSCWNNKVIDQNWWGLTDERRKHLSEFKNFVEYVAELDLDDCDVHLRRQSSVIDLNRLDYLGRFETLAADVDQIFERLGCPSPSLPHINKSQSGSSYTDHYTPELVVRVRDLYLRDVQFFNYHFD